jgi:hypothetical protein
MENKIKIFGLIPIGLLLIAIFISLLHIPNQALLIVLGILLFIFVEVPIFLLYLNKSNNSSRMYNIFAFLSLFIFIPCLFFFLQDFVAAKIAMVFSLISGAFLLYFFINELIKKRMQWKNPSFMHFFLLFVVLLIINVPIELQAPDYTFNIKFKSPTYSFSKGPLIYFDEAHNNIHTLKDRLLITGKLLENDGYVVKPLKKKITSKELLKLCKIYIVANALNEKNVDDWTNPTYSAFTEIEVENIKQWVDEGGSLLLIVDHMPVSGAASDLAKKFGFELRNGHAQAQPWKDNYFYRNTKTLSENIITNGRNESEHVDSILAFDGSGFKIPDDAISILTFDSTYFHWDPRTAWDLSSVEPYSIKGFSQGAYKKSGKGKIVVYGEAMMFTAQLGAGLSWVKLGMNSENCPNNYKLLLNTIHWLDGIMD